jgi:hypothetical protein
MNDKKHKMNDYKKPKCSGLLPAAKHRNQDAKSTQVEGLGIKGHHDRRHTDCLPASQSGGAKNITSCRRFAWLNGLDIPFPGREIALRLELPHNGYPGVTSWGKGLIKRRRRANQTRHAGASHIIKKQTLTHLEIQSMKIRSVDCWRKW